MLMLVDLFTSQQPLITFQPDNVTAQAFGAAKVYVILPNATLAPVFVLDIVSTVAAEAGLGFHAVQCSYNAAHTQRKPFYRDTFTGALSKYSYRHCSKTNTLK